MNKIVTITLNTAVDNITQVDKFKMGIVSKANSALFQSGKGINVARTVASLKYNVLALGFVGNNEASFFEELNSKNFHTNFIYQKGKTRMNITLLDKHHNLIIHTRAKGYSLFSKELRKFNTLLKHTVSKGDIVVISGSVPNKEISEAYKTIIQLCKVKGAKTILDSSGDELKYGIKSIPFIIKPNLEELQELHGEKINSEKEIVLAAEELNKKGIEYVFVSNGDKGMIVTQKGKKHYWKGFISKPIKKITGTEIGCGDASVAGIAISLIVNKEIEDIICFSIACGTANLYGDVPGLCDLKTVEKLLRKVCIEKKIIDYN